MFDPVAKLIELAGPKPRVALAFSGAFYAWGAPRFLPVVLALGFVDYWLARGVAAAKGTVARPRRAWPGTLIQIARLIPVVTKPAATSANTPADGLRPPSGGSSRRNPRPGMVAVG